MSDKDDITTSNAGITPDSPDEHHADSISEPIALSDTDRALEEQAEADIPSIPVARYRVPGDGDRKTLLSGMFRNWYLEYASYVILERAVPHIEDGLKPVQRRILHAMQTTDNGRFNKVAGIVGETMKYHPHGDASIGDALVQLGQKELLIDTQGNWGNILTGDQAAATRYIEARLSEFALETVFSSKITEWMPSYDGVRKEPVTLPVKFPLLLSQGVEGIAVGLSSKILPHNFNEIIDAAVAYLHGEAFSLLPDFQTGGLLDATRYNDGARGGSVKVRAKIEKIDSKTLAITELPFGKTTSTLIASIVAAQEKGKIKIRQVVDNTAASALILVHLAPGTSSDKTIDALYAFTDCEVSISPNCCVIWDRKPHFLSVSDVLRFSVDHTKEMLRQELEIRLAETLETSLYASLEKIFIENRIYKDKEYEEARSSEEAVAHVDSRLEPFKPSFFREITSDDILKLWKIPFERIFRFNSDKADRRIAELNAQIDSLRHDLDNIVEYTVRWYTHLKNAYGARFPRRTTLRGFDSIEAAKVAEANKRFYFDRKGGFIGTGLKDAEYMFTCSDLDDILVIYDTGAYLTLKVSDKLYVGKKGAKIMHVGIFKKSDRRTVYNVIYLNGKGGFTYKKRCFLTGLTREKEYDLTKRLPGSKILYLSVNPNGEAEVVKVKIDKNSSDPSGRRPRASEVMVNFAELEIKGKEALGNLVTKYAVDGKPTLQEKGASTLGGREVWFDRDVLRLNYDGRGESLGVFQGDDKVLVITRDGDFFTTDFSDANHYDDNILRMEKFDPSKVWTLALYDASFGFPYLKRFRFEAAAKPQHFVGNEAGSSIILLTDTTFPRLLFTFGGSDSVRPPQEIQADEFIGVKSFKAKGKRISLFRIDRVEELEPTKFPPEPEPVPEENADPEPVSAPVAVQRDLFDSLAAENVDSGSDQ